MKRLPNGDFEIVWTKYVKMIAVYCVMYSWTQLLTEEKAMFEYTAQLYLAVMKYMKYNTIKNNSRKTRILQKNI